MTKQLLLIDGGAPTDEFGQRAAAAKWLDAWSLGLKRAALSPPAIDIRLVAGGSGYPVELGAEQPSAAVEQEALLELRREILEEVAANRDVLDFHLAGTPTTERVQSLITALEAADGIDVPLILKTADAAHNYFADPLQKARIEAEIREKIDPARPVVVIAHSIGSIVAYDLLHSELCSSWNVPLFVTLGSPLGYSAIRKMLPTVRVPPNVERWCNARDAADIAAMFPLDYKHFPIKPIMPSILDKSDVQNRTADHHGVAGYIGDVDVAKWIHYALR